MTKLYSIFTGDKCYGKNRAGQGGDQEGKLQLPYLPSLYTQCSIYSPILKKSILPILYYQWITVPLFLIPFTVKFLQQVVYTLCFHFLTSQLLCNSKLSSFCSYFFTETIAKVTIHFHVTKSSGNESKFWYFWALLPPWKVPPSWISLYCSLLLTLLLLSLHWQLHYFWPSFKCLWCLCSSGFYSSPFFFFLFFLVGINHSLWFQLPSIYWWL